MSTEEPHTEAPSAPQAAPPDEPAPDATVTRASTPGGPSTNVILIGLAAIAVLVLGVYYLGQSGGLFHGSQTSAANYTVQPFTPQTEIVTASEHVMAHAQPDIASPGVVMFGQGVTINVNGRVSRGLGDDWYAITWNNQRAFVRVADAAAGSGAPPAPAEHQVQQPREVKPEEADEPDVADNDLPAIPDEPQSSIGRELHNVDWIRAPSARDFARYFPDRALEQGRSGRVVLDCTAEASGRLDCSVSEESPRGLRFGEAALAISRQVRLQPTQADGRSVAGGHLTLPLNFRAN
jgi:TonB family protein